MLKRILGISVLLIGLYALSVFAPASFRLASMLFYPLTVAQSYMVDPIKRQLTGQRTSYEVLQEAYDRLMQQHIRLQASADFMQARDALAFQERYTENNYCVAQVLERHIGADAHYFLLDKGSRDNIRRDAVVVYNDMLIGKITEVYPFYSRCMLITDQACKVGVYVADSDVQGVLQGTENGLLHLLHVSHLQNVRVGALLITSGNGLVFPRGFGVARTLSVQSDGLTLAIECEPLLDVNQITYCAILMR